MRAIRIGAVGYLNARPLVEGLQSDGRFSIRFDVPARCAELLATGAIDVGLIPAAEFRAEEYEAIPGICIGSRGAVSSVALFSQKPVEAVQSIALDESSRTSTALVRVLCAERWNITPVFSSGPPDLPTMLRRSDAALLIGDPALEAEPARLGVSKIDLGAEWTAWTGLPFVWALWAGRRGAVAADVCVALQAACDRGRGSVETIAHDYARGDAARFRRAVEYLQACISYDLDPAHVTGLERFLVSAAAIGAVPRPGVVRFAGSADARVTTA